MIMTIINCLLSGFVAISTSTAQHGESLQITGFSKISAHFIPNVIYCKYECHGGKGTIWCVNLSSSLCSRCSKKNIVLMKVVLSVYMAHVVSQSPFQTPPISCCFTHPVLSLKQRHPPTPAQQAQEGNGGGLKTGLLCPSFPMLLTHEDIKCSSYCKKYFDDSYMYTQCFFFFTFSVLFKCIFSFNLNKYLHAPQINGILIIIKVHWYTL